MTLPRRTPLRRTPMARGASKLPRVRRKRNIGRKTGPTLAQRATVHARSGDRCERCGIDLAATVVGRSVHHRRRRGMGGDKSPAINSPANLLDLCGTGTTGCHGWVETHRTEATIAGWLVPIGVDPASWPVLVWMPGAEPTHVLLTHDGDYAPTEHR